jgi:hypothetical protein
MNRGFFNFYVETQLAPTLRKGDVLRRENEPPGSFSCLPYLDNLATHRSPKAAAILKEIGADLVSGQVRPLDAFVVPQTFGHTAPT